MQRFFSPQIIEATAKRCLRSFRCPSDQQLAKGGAIVPATYPRHHLSYWEINLETLSMALNVSYGKLTPTLDERSRHTGSARLQLKYDGSAVPT
jgi:hypothetical protein